MRFDARGRWHRWDTKPTTEDYLALSINSARRIFGGLDRLTAGFMQWHMGKQQIGEIGLTVLPGRGVRLDYKHNGEPITELIQLAHTEQRLGGYRAWWLCPACGRRCGVLYGGRRFLCRLCYRLPYPVQMAGNPMLESIDGRLYRLRRKLKATDRSIVGAPPPRPKGMHWRTYDRLFDGWVELQRLRNMALAIEVSGLLGDMPISQAELWQGFREEVRRRKERG
ncbi:MAG: hypothetical protein KF893_04675 [Caldilineaceae bacterium]|nr:hypothetical protein [Caldilineaceae bacterium]